MNYIVNPGIEISSPKLNMAVLTSSNVASHCQPIMALHFFNLFRL